jgi:hypothetical protein
MSRIIDEREFWSSHDRRAQIADDDLAFAAHIPDERLAAFIYMHMLDRARKPTCSRL